MCKASTSRICTRIMSAILSFEKIEGFNREFERLANDTRVFTVNIGNNVFVAKVDAADHESYKYGQYHMDFRQWVADIKSRYEKHKKKNFFDALKREHDERVAMTRGFKHADSVVYSTGNSSRRMIDVVEY